MTGLLSIALRSVVTGRMESGPTNALANLARAIVIASPAGEVVARAGIADRGPHESGERAAPWRRW